MKYNKIMEKKKKAKIPSTLSQYLRLKAKEYQMSECQLSKLIIPGSSGSLIASIRYDQSKLSEKKIKKIADFFNANPIILTFMAGRMPKKVHELIMKDKDFQFFLVDILKKTKDTDCHIQIEIDDYRFKQLSEKIGQPSD